ncbi:hypothetical protein U1Q18_022492 [Sarracenia purpurea var. burkii]
MQGGPENPGCTYRGVRQRIWGKWVAEIQEQIHGGSCQPKKKPKRLWLARMSKPEFKASELEVMANEEAKQACHAHRPRNCDREVAMVKVEVEDTVWGGDETVPVIHRERANIEVLTQRKSKVPKEKIAESTNNMTSLGDYDGKQDCSWNLEEEETRPTDFEPWGTFGTDDFEQDYNYFQHSLTGVTPEMIKPFGALRIDESALRQDGNYWSDRFGSSYDPWQNEEDRLSYFDRMLMEDNKSDVQPLWAIRIDSTFGFSNERYENPMKAIEIQGGSDFDLLGFLNESNENPYNLPSQFQNKETQNYMFTCNNALTEETYREKKPSGSGTSISDKLELQQGFQCEGYQAARILIL